MPQSVMLLSTLLLVSPCMVKQSVGEHILLRHGSYLAQTTNAHLHSLPQDVLFQNGQVFYLLSLPAGFIRGGRGLTHIGFTTPHKYVLILCMRVYL